MAALLLGALCQASAQESGSSQFTNIYQRASAQFVAADFFKPLAPKEEDVTYKLAPLLLQEVRGETERSKSGVQGRFGRLALSGAGVLEVDAAQPTVYVLQDTVQIKGRLHPRVSYVWFYSVEPTATGKATLPFQGVRLTLNATGQAVVWEVLAEETEAELLFVAQSLETAAAAQFGKPLAGRRYAIERGTNEAPQAVVARVIEDGPMPMGPIVYLSAGTRSVATLLCRCMPAQAKQVGSSSSYEIKPLLEEFTRGLVSQTRAQAKFQTAFWPGELPNGRLERCLRLPDNF